MKYNWDLEELYVREEDFYFDMTLVRDKIKKLSEHREIKIDGNSLYDLMKQCFEIREINAKTLLYASLNYYLDINNAHCIKMKEQAEELDGFVLEETSFIDELLAIIEEEKLVEFYKECPLLEEYHYYIYNNKRLAKHLCREKMDEVSHNLLDINREIINYNMLFKNMDLGKIGDISLNNSNIGEYLVSLDRDLRKESFYSMNSSYKAKALDYFSIINKIISFRKVNASLKKYTSVLDGELDSEDIDKRFIDNLINSVTDNIVLMNRYLKLKCEYLNIDNPTLYDINLGFGSNDRNYSLDDIFNVFDDVFKVFGDDYLKDMHFFFKEGHLDLECNDKKHPSIVFSWNTYSFMNYKDRYIDLKNLAHEIGHIMNYYLSSCKQPYIYVDSSVFVGEVASLVNEILVNEYLYEKASNKDEKIFYLTKIIENFISQVYRQTMYTEFENVLYNSKNLSLDLLNDEYLVLVKKYYGDVVCVLDDICCEWMRVGHLFRWSYYVYKYAAGYILAFNVVKKFKEEDYINNYMDFLASGSSCSNEELLKKLDINLYDKDLMENSFKLLNDYILKLNDLLSEEK